MLTASEAVILLNNFEDPLICKVDINHEGETEQKSKEKEKDKTSLELSSLNVDNSKKFESKSQFLDINVPKLSAHQELNDPPPEFL
jgi:hypothetical protein